MEESWVTGQVEELELRPFLEVLPLLDADLVMGA